MNKQKLSVIFTGIATILILLSIFFPWWVWNENNKEKIVEYFPLKIEIKEGGKITTINIFGEEKKISEFGMREVYLNSIKILILTLALLLSTVFICIFSVISTIMANRKKFKEKTAIIFSLLTTIFLLIVPLSFIILFPSGVSKDLNSENWKGGVIGEQGNFPETNKTTKWGLGIGFYLSFLAFIINTIGFVFLFISREKLPKPTIPTPIPQPQIPKPQVQPLPPPPPPPKKEEIPIPQMQPPPPPPKKEEIPIPQMQPPPPPPKKVVKIKCGKCGNIIDITSPERPIEIICNCGSKLVLK